MTNRPRQRGGCMRFLKVVWTVIFFFVLLILISINILFSNILGETCGWVHPLIFEVEASIIEDTGEMITSPFTRLPSVPDDIALFNELSGDFNIESSSDASSNEASQLDTVLRIYDESGEILLAQNDDVRSGDFSSAISSFGLTEPATIIVEVGTFSDSSDGQFTLSVTPVDDTIFSYETVPANRIDDVYNTEIELDNSGSTNQQVIYIGERIQFTMTVEPNQAYDFAVDGTDQLEFSEPEELDTYLRIYDESGTVLLAENDDDVSLSSVITNFGVEENQVIIIEVGTFNESMVGDYLLEVSPINGNFESSSDTPDDTSAVIFDTGIELSNTGDSVPDAIDQEQRRRYTMIAEGGQAYEIRVAGNNALVSGSSDESSTIRLDDPSALFLSTERNAANRWHYCLQFFGFVSDNGYIINSNGFIWFVSGTDAEEKLAESCVPSNEQTIREFLEQCVQANIRVSPEGRMIFFVLLAILVVSLPVFIVDSLEGLSERIWYLFLMLVVVQATTTAMLFLHLGQVSGIDSLSEFGYGIFGGITTGAALTFIDKVVDRARDNTTMIAPDDN